MLPFLRALPALLFRLVFTAPSFCQVIVMCLHLWTEMKALCKAEAGADLGALSYVFICEIDKINKLCNIPDLRNWAYMRKMQIS